MTDTEQHEWFFYERLGYECCRKCGIIRREDDKNKPCKGIVKIGPKSRELEWIYEKGREAIPTGFDDPGDDFPAEDYAQRFDAKCR